MTEKMDYVKANHLVTSGSAPVGTVSDRVQKLKNSKGQSTDVERSKVTKSQSTDDEKSKVTKSQSRDVERLNVNKNQLTDDEKAADNTDTEKLKVTNINSYKVKKPKLNGVIGKSQTLNQIHKKEFVEMNGFMSHGRISGGKYLVTGTPQGVTNLGFSDSSQSLSTKPSVTRQLSYTDDLFDGSDHVKYNKATQNGHINGHGHFLAHNGTLKASKLTLARRHQSTSSGHSSSHGLKTRHSHGSGNYPVSQFDIELNETAPYQYRPGEEISGSIRMEINRNLEIRYVELIVVGVGTGTLRKGSKLFTHKENYLYKRTCVIGNSESKRLSCLTPGKYVSNFRFRLSKDVPSSLEYEEQNSGLRMDVTYFLKARLIDSSNNAVIKGKGKAIKHRSLVSRKLIFKVLRPFDVNMLPDASAPINYTEEIVLSCGNNSTATVSVALDRSVFLAGDFIRLQLSLTIPDTRKIKEIICCLQQHISFKSPQQRATYSLIQLDNKNPEETAIVTIKKFQRTSSYEIVIPTHNAMLPSFLYGCKMMTVTYSVKTVMKFSQAGGKLSISIPIAIGPCAEPIYSDRTAFKKAVPVFNRHPRFPCFTTASRNSSFYSQEMESQSSRNINVVSKYNVSPFGKCFMCCFGGFGGI